MSSWDELLKIVYSHEKSGTSKNYESQYLAKMSPKEFMINYAVSL